MILSGRDIQWYVEQHKIVIEPCQPIQYRQNGVDLILEKASYVAQNFYLGCTREWLELPDDLMAFVQLRSSYARRGFMLPPTIVDAGFKGNLTLEIARFGYEAFPIGERFAHLIFARMSSPAVPYDGKYQHQTGITPAIKD
jgi:dCTP deaminase